MKRSDIYVSACMVFVSAAYLYAASALPQGASAGVPRAGSFPFYIGVAFLVASLSYFGNAAYAAASRSMEEGRPVFDKDVLILLGLMVGYVVAMPAAGFTLSTGVFSFVLLKAYFRKSWGRAAIASVLIVVVPYLIFVSVLNIPLPVGRWFE